MPSEITVRADGTAEAAFALLPAWHGLGLVLDHPMTSAEAIKAANLDWEVVKEPVYDFDGITYTQVPGAALLKRSDNGKILGVVGKRYVPVQNIEAFNFIDSLVLDGTMTYEAAFSLKGGKQIVVLARMPHVDFVSDEDTLKRYIMFSMGHDGANSIKVGAVSVRTVCYNTFLTALRQDSDTLISIPHKGNPTNKLMLLQRALSYAEAEFNKFTETARKLVSVKWDSTTIDTYLNTLFGGTESKKITKVKNDILARLNNNNQQIGGMKCTAWAALCAVIEHIDHTKRRGKNNLARAEARFKTALLGVGKRLKIEALDLAVELSRLSV